MLESFCTGRLSALWSRTLAMGSRNNVPFPPNLAWILFHERLRRYIRACRGVHVHVVLCADDSVRMVAKPNRFFARDRELFGTELCGAFGERSGWHLVIQTGNFDVFLHNEPRPGEAIALWPCKYSHRHACRSLLFSPYSCCMACAKNFAVFNAGGNDGAAPHY